MDGEGDALCVDAGLEFAVFRAVGGEHKEHYARDAAGDILEHGENCKEHDVVVADKPGNQAYHRRCRRTGEVDLHLVEAADEFRHKHGEYQHGHHGKRTDKQAEVLVVKQIIRYKEVEAAGDIQGAVEEESDIVNEQIFVGEEVLEHTPDGEILVVFAAVTLLALEAYGSHCRQSDDGADDCDHFVGEAELLIDEYRADHRGQNRADARPDALVGHQRGPLVELVAHCGDIAENRHIAERVSGIPQHIGYRKPRKLERFVGAVVLRDEEEQDGGDGYRKE